MEPVLNVGSIFLLLPRAERRPFLAETSGDAVSSFVVTFWMTDS